MENKLRSLLIKHRQNCFHPDEFIADLNSKAIDRLKRTKTYNDMGKQSIQRAKTAWEERANRQGY